MNDSTDNTGKKEDVPKQKRQELIFDFSQTSWHGNQHHIGTLAYHLQKFGQTELIGYQHPQTGQPVCAEFILRKNTP